MVWEYTFTAVGSGRGLRAVDEIERVARAICHFDVFSCVFGGYSASGIGEEVSCGLAMNGDEGDIEKQQESE